MAVILPVAMSLSLTSCGSMVQSYRLRFWEKYRINAEQCYKKSQYSQARAKAVEALALAEGFGDSDFRLGVSLCDLGDIDKAVGKNRAAEDHYKRAIKVFEAAGSRAAEAAMKAKSANSNSGTKGENDSDEAMMCKLIREDLANGLAHLADLYAIQEKYGEAAKCFDEAANLYQSMVGGNRWLLDDCAMGQELVSCLVGLAQVSLAKKDPDEAAKAYRRALDYAVAAQCPEHVLTDIRDAYLELLQENGRSKEANQLLADIDWQKCTAAGLKAYYQKNIPEADALLHRAYMDAQQSIFSERRMMKSLYYLLSVLILEDKPAEVEQCRMLAHKYVLSRNVRFDQDYDSMLTFLANYSLNAKNPYQAIDSLKQQQSYRINEYGPLSIQICETLALLGTAQLYAGQKDEAEKSAKTVYDVIKKNYMTNRSAHGAMDLTYKLLGALNHGDESLEILNQIVTNNMKHMVPSDPRIMGYRATLFIQELRFQKFDQATALAKDIVAMLEKGTREQRIEAYPYLVLMMSVSLSHNLYDTSEPLVILGQSILKKDMQGMAISKENQYNWDKDLAKMENHFGKKY